MGKQYRFFALGLLLVPTACGGSAGTDPAGNVAGTTHGTPTSPPEASPSDEVWNAGWPRGGAQLSQVALKRAQALPGCIVLAQDGTDAPSYARRSFDAELGLVRQLPVDSDGASTDPSDPRESHALYWRWDGAGRLQMKAGGGSGNRPFRSDYQRDERGNVTASLFTYSDALDLGDAATGELYRATYYDNSYGSDGLLSEHRAESAEGNTESLRGPVTYEHDEQGRCQRIESSNLLGSEVEQREYDAAGRLELRTTDATLQGRGSDPVQVVQSLQYDDQSRLIRTESDGEAGFDISKADGVPDEFARTRYYADGSKLIETLGFTGDLRSDEVERNGVLEFAWHHLEFWSAGCEEVEANVPAPTSLACSADD